MGVRRLREEFGLEVVEYPTTLKMGSSAEARAADLTAAFGDPDIKAVIAGIGADDQIRVVPYLDPDVMRANPKPFFGSSDNTNLLAWLWSLEIQRRHGSTVMVQLGRPVRCIRSWSSLSGLLLSRAGEYALSPVTAYGDRQRDWADPATFDQDPELFPCDGWIWRGETGRRVDGVAWGGCWRFWPGF